MAVEKIGQRCVRGGRITQRAACQIETPDEILGQLAFNAETYANTSAVAIEKAGRILKEILSAHSNVSIEAEAAQQTFES